MLVRCSRHWRGQGYASRGGQGAGCSSFAQIATTTGRPTISTPDWPRRPCLSRSCHRRREWPGPYSNVAIETARAAFDTTPPTAPATLTAMPSGTQIALSWPAATDNVGVTGYQWSAAKGPAAAPLPRSPRPPVRPAIPTPRWRAPRVTRTRVRATDAATLLGPYSNTASASTPSAPGGPTGLIAGYSFNAGSGTTAVDSSGNGITGTLSGATWTAAGRYGNALSFNGANAYVNLGNTTALQGTGMTTWAAWVFATGVPW